MSLSIPTGCGIPGHLKLLTLIVSALLASPVFAADALPVPDAVKPYLNPSYFRVPPEMTYREITRYLNQHSLREGKRVRPLLCHLAAGLLGAAPGGAGVVELSCVVEWVHSASLIHDDVIDRSTTRRGKPSLWKRTTPTKAVLIGDWLQATALEIAIEMEEPHHGRAILDTIKDMARGEVVQSQILKKKTYTLEDWKLVSQFKTGVLFAWALTAPAHELGLAPDVAPALRELGLTLGRLFQAQDDLQDALDERGEVNVVLLKAAEIEGISPLAKKFKPESLREASEATLEMLRAEALGAEKLVLDISDDFARRARAEEFEPKDPQHQIDCKQALIDFTRLLAKPPKV